MSVVIPIGIAVAVVVFLSFRRGSKPREIAGSLSLADRQFIADELEPITRLPLNTSEDEDAWYSATRHAMQQLGERFPDVASVVPHELYHYFDDADIHRKDPSYRAAREKRIEDFIRTLREQT